MALFGEKYGKEVRVVNYQGLPVELCGGTVGNTFIIGLFKIVKEYGTGIRNSSGLAVISKGSLSKLIVNKKMPDAVGNLESTQLKEVPHKVEGLRFVNCKRKCRIEAESAVQRQQAMSSRMFKSKRPPLHCQPFQYTMRCPSYLCRTTGNKKITSDVLVCRSYRDKQCPCSQQDKRCAGNVIKELAQSSMDVVVVNCTWPWQEWSNQAEKSKNCWMP